MPVQLQVDGCPIIYIRYWAYSIVLTLTMMKPWWHGGETLPLNPIRQGRSLVLDNGNSDRILQPFRHFTYVITHSPTLPSLFLRHSPFFNPSIASPTSQFILQPFRRFTYVTAHSPTLPLLYLRHSSFSNLSFAIPASKTLHLIHLARCPWCAFTRINTSSEIVDFTTAICFQFF